MEASYDLHLDWEDSVSSSPKAIYCGRLCSLTDKYFLCYQNIALIGTYHRVVPTEGYVFLSSTHRN